MITKFDIGDIVKFEYNKQTIFGGITLIVVTQDSEIIYEILLEKPIHNREKVWYDESKLKLQRRRKK